MSVLQVLLMFSFVPGAVRITRLSIAAHVPHHPLANVDLAADKSIRALPVHFVKPELPIVLDTRRGLVHSISMFEAIPELALVPSSVGPPLCAPPCLQVAVPITLV